MKYLEKKDIQKLGKVRFFGYGSLLFHHGINGRGMRHIYQPDDLSEVVVKGFKRGMYALVMNRAYYGICKKKNAVINGTLSGLSNRIVL